MSDVTDSSAKRALEAIRRRTDEEDFPLHLAADIEQIIVEVGGSERPDVDGPIVAWIDRTLALPMYRNVAEGDYGEAVVTTLKTVRKMLNGTTRPDASWRTTRPSESQVHAALVAFWGGEGPVLGQWTSGATDAMRAALQASAAASEGGHHEP